MINKKRVLGSIVLSLFIFTNVGAESNSTSSFHNVYKDVNYNSNLYFKAARDGAVVEMKWSKYEDSDFKYYKLLRSETHESPVYPDQPAFKFLSDIDTTELKIKNYGQNDATYRVCVITHEKARHCSNAVKLEGYSKEEKTYKKPDTSKEAEAKYKKEENKKYNNSTNGIDSNTAKKAKILVERFIEKIENKFSSSSDRTRAIESVVGKLEALAEKKPKSARLINYINSLLKTKLETYDNSLEEIEKIFNDL